MKKILLPCLFVGGVVFTNPAVGGDVGQLDNTVQKPEKSMSARSSIEMAILNEFNKTSLQTRIIKIRVKRERKKTRVYLTWHPTKKENIATDTFIIIKIVTQIIPNFYFVSLKAIDPTYMRWSGRVYWNTIIKRKAIIINRFVDRQPQPLYQ